MDAFDRRYSRVGPSCHNDNGLTYKISKVTILVMAIPTHATCWILWPKKRKLLVNTGLYSKSRPTKLGSV